jgi:hypothetical protein
MAACAALLVSGCATSKVSARRDFVGAEKLAKPGRIIVHDFVASPDDLPDGSAMEGRYERHAEPQTPEQVELGRQLGSQIAERLVANILKMGLPAERAGSGPPAATGDLVIKGELVSIDEGNRAKRVLIGFGAGAAELKTLVEIYQVTADGLRPLDSSEVTAAGGKLPGMLVPVAGGAAAGRAVTTAAVAGGVSAAKEVSSESVGGAAQRTADTISETLEKDFGKRNWLLPK